MDYVRYIEDFKLTRTIVEQGWTKGRFEAFVGDKVCYCLLGALEHAAEETYATAQCRLFIKANSIHHNGRSPSGTVVMWNDAPERTHEEVLAALDKTIAYLEQKHNKQIDEALHDIHVADENKG